MGRKVHVEAPTLLVVSGLRRNEDTSPIETWGLSTATLGWVVNTLVSDVGHPLTEVQVVPTPGTVGRPLRT